MNKGKRQVSLRDPLNTSLGCFAYGFLLKCLGELQVPLHTIKLEVFPSCLHLTTPKIGIYDGNLDRKS
ncbi:hypothetical protein M8C21_033885 [Ambrosia artemisiifolia]|uniref:Uncharacterized protein n=1 Tax=Ambrosia artemisiifolia TaxID=4212 RepID=A0AAD5CVB6_AMBAR|nr:hypothetical protein M8C21_033885 [Ambrosia artemisiifolia]